MKKYIIIFLLLMQKYKQKKKKKKKEIKNTKQVKYLVSMKIANPYKLKEKIY